MPAIRGQLLMLSLFFFSVALIGQFAAAVHLRIELLAAA
jgi:hypothetical protein